MLQPGHIIGAYRIETLLGRGAMGAVYRSIRIEDGAVVAIKTIHADLLAGGEHEAILARFRQEAQIGMRLRHPLIVRAYDCGEQDGLLYLTMELVEGQELGHLLKQQPTLPLGMNLAIILQVLNALAYAHRQGVIHRDIKPANIMVRQDYTIALTDFGIAHLSGSQLTQVGELLGSPLYMAPEQLRGEPVDLRADLFSTGVLLYFLLTQRKPFMADSLAALMQKILHEEPPPPSQVHSITPVVFDAVLHRALAKLPEQRFSSASEFAAVLRQTRTEALNATVIALPHRRPIAPRGETDAGQTTKVVPTMETWIEPMTGLVQECLAERATGVRLERLTEHLAMALTLANRASSRGGEPAGRRRLQQWCASLPLTALVEQIQRDAPLPGRLLREARGDWLELVRLFALLQNAGCQMNQTLDADAARARIVEELTSAFLNYSNNLNQLLFSVDGPQLTRISADLMRLDLLQLALEELGADAEARHVRQTLLLFANQVMSRVNSLIQQVLDGHDPLARFDVANVLVEVEELITLAERLLEGSSAVVVSTGQPGGVAMAGFIDNARLLAEMLADELVQHLQQEQRCSVETGQPAFSEGQPVFIGRLRQLGLLYRFAAHWQTGQVRMEALRQWAEDMHRRLEQIADALLTALQTTVGAASSVVTDLLWARLTIIAELAEQFGWPELHQRVLLAARSWVLVD
ncbi:MAG: serine/threonine-protein kinase [Candidatus Competibacteraceae bacterium]|jgi:hypothetical protein